ncbi:MAG: sugar transferase [Candidatus Omnitrophota bacterium]
MIQRMSGLFIRSVYVGFDIVSVSISIVLACRLRENAFTVDLHTLFQDTTSPYYIVFLSWLVAVLCFNSIYKLYATHREWVQGREFGQVLRSVFFAGIVVMAVVYTAKIHNFPRSVFLLMMVLTAVFFIFWRAVKRRFVAFLVARGYNNFNVVIIGAGKVGMMLAAEIERRPEMGLRIIGFLDDRKTTEMLGGRYRVLGRLSDLADVAARHFAHKIMITIHPDGDVFHGMLDTANDLGMGVRVVPQAFDKATGEILKYNIGFVPVLEYCDIGQTRRQSGKRAFDVVFSMLGLIVLAPVFLCVAALIKCDSAGPVFYFSRRYGRGGQIFRMWKFRSMSADADEKLAALKEKNEVDGPIFKIRQDPRVTRLGRFLRKYSLDELPQIINVLMGDMSIVGPRPLPLDQVEQEDFKQLKRLEVHPGITGLWQVRGRSDLTFGQLVKWDIWYINNWSFMLDIQILMETIPVVLKGKGAY